MLRLIFIAFFIPTSLYSQWTSSSFSAPQSLSGIEFQDTNRGYAISGSVIYSTITGVENLEIIYSGYSLVFQDLHAQGDSLYIVCNDYNDNTSKLFFSEDRGENWIIKTLTNNTRLISIKKIDDVILIGGSSGIIYISTDNGNTFLNKSINIDERINDFIILNDGSIIAIGGLFETAIVYKSFNTGVTWNKINIPGEVKELNSIVINENGVLIISGDDETVIESQNMGESWLNLSFDSDINYECMDLINNTGFRVGGNTLTTGYIFRSLNGGQSWIQSLSIDDASFTDLSMIDENNSVACTNIGTVYIYKNEKLSVKEKREETKVFPSIFNTYLRIETNSNIEPIINVFNINGQKVISEVGNYISTTSLIPGKYFISVNNNELLTRVKINP